MFVSVPTGFEKSLVYQILLTCARNLLKYSSLTDLVPLVLVIPPLIVLMQNQAQKLNSMGLRPRGESDITCIAVCLADSMAGFG